MVTRRMLPAVLAATFALGSVAASPVLAAGPAGVATPAAADKTAAAQPAGMTSVAAITAAEAAARGRAIRFELEQEGAAHVYEVRVLAGEEIHTVKLDAATGAVRSNKRDGLLQRLLDPEDRDEIAALMRAPRTLQQAVEAAEAAEGGRAIEAGWEEEDGVAGFEVEMRRPDGRKVKVLVDAESGQVRSTSHGERSH